MTLAVSSAAASPLRDTNAAAPVCAAEVASQEFLDVAFQSFGKRGEEEEEEEETTNTVWHLLSTIYFPLLFLRLRRSFFGLTTFVRSILFGQCLQFLIVYLSPSPATWETLSPWLEPLLGNPHSKDPHAWPPPSLRVLAILTVLAFIVHPDGMTWIMLGKLRNALYTLFESSTTCWNIVIADNGILTTLAALATFASILFLIFVMFKTLTPRTPKVHTTTKALDRKKKKRKGNHPRGGRGRIKGKGKPHLARHASPPRMADENVPRDAEEETEEASMDESNHKTDFLPKELTANGIAAESSRPCVQSSSTLETVAVDDQSVESASVQSIASAPSAASTVVSRSPQSSNQEEERHKKNADNKKHTATNKKGRMGSASRGYGASGASPSRPDVYRPPMKNANAYSPVNPVNTSPYSARSRSRRGGGNPNADGGRPFRSLHDRMSSPTSNDSSFFTPVSPSAHTYVRERMTNDLNVPTLQNPILIHHPPTASSSLFSQEPATPPANHTRNAMFSKQDRTNNVFYNAPSYNASKFFSNDGRRDIPRKMELAAFLGRVGITGTVREDLVEALNGVDSLYMLSDAQFELYHVSPDKKLQIDMMLEDRRRARMESTRLSSPGASPGAIRPPPGLTSPAGVVKSNHQSAALMSPPRLNQVTYASSETSPSPGYSTAGRTDVDFGSSPSLSGSRPQIPPFSLFYSREGSKNSVYEQGDEEIEAELQELGGQMVGSILDF